MERIYIYIFFKNNLLVNLRLVNEECLIIALA